MSSSSLFMRAELVSLCSRQWLSWTPNVILQHLWTKAAWEWAVMIHQSTAPFLRLNPTMLPFVLVLLFNICQIVWSTGTCENPWDVARWTKSPFTRWVCASGWVSREQHHVGQVGWKIAQIEYCLEIQHGGKPIQMSSMAPTRIFQWTWWPLCCSHDLKVINWNRCILSYRIWNEPMQPSLKQNMTSHKACHLLKRPSNLNSASFSCNW